MNKRTSKSEDNSERISLLNHLLKTVRSAQILHRRFYVTLQVEGCSLSYDIFCRYAKTFIGKGRLRKNKDRTLEKRK